jgi:putative hydrolase of the HAD superfamily
LKSCLALDLGGVVLNICPTWEEALRGAGVTAPGSIQGKVLNDFPQIHTFQKGEISYEEYCSALGDFLGGISPEDAAKVHLAILKEEIVGMSDLVAEVKAWGWKVGILSNTNYPHIDFLRDSDRLPIGKLFDGFVTSYDAGFNKPEPEIYSFFQEKMGVSHQEVVFFDDFEENVIGAREVGWDAYLVKPDGTSATQIRNILWPLRN